MAIKRRSPGLAAPLVGLARPVFAWSANDRTGGKDGIGSWSGATPIEAISPVGKALSFTGNTTTALTRVGASTAAQPKFWFASVFRWRVSALGGGNFPQLLGTSTANNGWRVGATYTSGSTATLGIVKGGVAALSAVTILDNVWYAAVGSNREDTGEHYCILLPIGGGDLLRTATSSTATSIAGNGSAGIGIARTDYSGAWAGDIAFAAAGFDFLPEAQARQWLSAPRSAVGRRRIWAPVSAGGISGSLSATLAGVTMSAAGSVAIAGAVSQTLAAATVAATGKIAIAATASPTLGALASSAIGAVALTGTTSATLGGASLAATGVLTAVGSGALDATLGGATVVATGTVGLSAALSQTLGVASIEAAGVLAQVNTGAVSATLGGASLSAAGHVDIAAALGVTLGDLVLSAPAALSLSGALAKTLGGATLASTGVVGEIEADVAYPLRGLSQAGYLSDPQTYPLGGLTQD